MINAKYNLYNYYTIGAANEYGQQTINADPAGQVKLAVYVSSQSIQDNILFQGCQFLALTHDTKVDDTYIIEYGKERLKVLYVAETAPNRPRMLYLTRMG